MNSRITITLLVISLTATNSFAQSSVTNNSDHNRLAASSYQIAAASNNSASRNATDAGNYRSSNTAVRQTGNMPMPKQSEGHISSPVAAYRSQGSDQRLIANNSVTATGWGNYSANVNATGSWSAAQRSKSPVTPANWVTRYNPVAQQCFRYYGSSVSHNKSHTRHVEPVHIKYQRPGYRQPGYNLAYCDLMYFCASFYDELIWTEYNNGAGYMSFDGYMVYGTDTMPGIVSIDQQKAYLEQPVDAKSEYGFGFPLVDKDLKEIALFSGNKELYLARLADGENLWRVLHTGKLKVYDDNYSFPTVANVNFKNVRVMLPGEHTYLQIDNKKQLTWCINKTYGLNLKAKDYSWKALFGYINTLN